jgi:hypothetical protein
MDGLLDYVTSLTVPAEERELLDRLAGLAFIIPPELIQQVLNEANPNSTRKCRLNAEIMVWLVLAMGIFASYPIRSVFRASQRFRDEDDIPSRSALCKARKRLGIRPLQLLFQKVVTLQCQPEVPGGFYAGLRMMGIDGVVFTCPFTPANVAAFGLPKGGNTSKSKGGYPVVGKVSLVELGSHVEYAFVPRSQDHGESTKAKRLVRHLKPGMLVFLDAGFFGYCLLRMIIESGAMFLVNVSSTPLLKPHEVLPDGSCLSKIYANNTDRKKDQNGIVVRVLKYQLDDPQRPGHGETRRLVTTLLDHVQHPIKELVNLYHERWEHELVNDEQKTHQDPRRPGKSTHLRSESPSGVIQELYGLSLAHFVIRKAMFEAASKIKIDPDRVSFVGAIQILQVRLPECDPNPTASSLRKWFDRLLRELTGELVEPRRNRVNPRVVKAARRKWKAKKPTDYGLAKLSKTFMDSILVT